MNKTRALTQVSMLCLTLAATLSAQDQSQAATGTTASARTIVRPIIRPPTTTPALPAAGPVAGLGTTLAGSRLTASEHRWVIRILSYHPDAVVPRRIYTASCTHNGQRRMFASLTSKTAASATTIGMLLSANVAANGTVGGVTQRVFTGCEEMQGIAASADCGTVVSLCRKPAGSTGATKDLVASLPNTATGNDWRNWLTAEAGDDQMWLFEWKGAPAAPTGAATPASYIVSKAIGGGWEYGHQHVVIGPSHYGVSMKSTTQKDARGTQHQGDSYVVIHRATPAIDTSRGWKWACGPGHTLSNRPVVGATGAFAAMCTTDWNGAANNYGKGGLWMHVERKSQSLIRSIYKSTQSGLRFNGGTGPILPLSGGGYIGVIVGSDNPGLAQPTKIALVRMNADGVVQSSAWVANISGYFVSYPQLVSLGNDSTGTQRFLIGWAQMMANSSTSSFDAPNPDQTQRLATRYFVQEFNQNGVAKTVAREIADGWGEQDTMVPLGKGMAGWAYIPNPRYRKPLPSPNSPTLRWMTYRSTAM